MILLVDIGNTRIKWAYQAQTELRAPGSLAHAGESWESRLEDAWTGFAGDVGKDRIERVVASCVANDSVRARVAELVRRRWGIEPEWVVAMACGYGVRNAYTEPRRLGPDRWAALVGARGLVDGAACIVDCGSAVTLDVLHADGRHLGGWILPGLSMMRRVLSEQTGGLPPVKPTDQGVFELGYDTATCILRGTQAVVVAAIARGLEQARTITGTMPACLLTGGDAEGLVASLSEELPARGLVRKSELKLIPQLVLQGLSVIAGGRFGRDVESTGQ